MGDTDDLDRWRAVLRELTSALPPDYEGKRRALASISHLFHEEIGRAIETALNEDAGTLESMDLAARRSWASQRNADLRNLHLAFRCPKTDRPATLIVDACDAAKTRPRYRIQVYLGGKATFSLTTTRLPHLKVMEDDLRRENLAHPHPERRGQSR